MKKNHSTILTLHALNEIPDASRFLAETFPSPHACRTGIHELLVNAIEHGNLGLGNETKTMLLRLGRWEEEIKRRATLTPFRSRKVVATVAANDRMCYLSIEDDGIGFSWKDAIKNMNKGLRPNGRGLMIAFGCAFDQIVFNPLGNKVMCATRIPT